MIYHWCPASDWEFATEEYRPREYARDGFVHCSFHHQVEATASRLDAGRHDLVLLCIDDSDLSVVTEDCYETGEEYPHAYGPIPVASVVRVLPFPPRRDGTFRLPPDTPTDV